MLNTSRKGDIGEAISDKNDLDAASQLSGDAYTIVGLADSPLYLNGDRGTTAIGSGTLAGFVYLPEECFTREVYTEAFLTLNETAEIYSDQIKAGRAFRRIHSIVFRKGRSEQRRDDEICGASCL